MRVLPFQILDEIAKALLIHQNTQYFPPPTSLNQELNKFEHRFDDSFSVGSYSSLSGLRNQVDSNSKWYLHPSSALTIRVINTHGTVIYSSISQLTFHKNISLYFHMCCAKSLSVVVYQIWKYSVNYIFFDTQNTDQYS